MQTLIGRKAPEFKAKAVVDGGTIVNDFSLSQYKNKKHVIFFFYPADFTFVCPTELIAFQNKLAEFEKRNVQVVGCSVDSEFSHWKWLQTSKDDGGIEGVQYPIVSDLSKTISGNFGVLAGYYESDEDGNLSFEGNPQAYRGLFLIDKSGIVRHMLINDMPLGRSVNEALRMVDALQFYEENGEVCPADWKQGEDSLKEDQGSIAEYLSNH